MAVADKVVVGLWVALKVGLYRDADVRGMLLAMKHASERGETPQNAAQVVGLRAGCLSDDCALDLADLLDVRLAIGE